MKLVARGGQSWPYPDVPRCDLIRIRIPAELIEFYGFGLVWGSVGQSWPYPDVPRMELSRRGDYPDDGRAVSWRRDGQCRPVPDVQRRVVFMRGEDGRGGQQSW